MGDSAINSFSKGMSKDLGKTVPQEGTYLEGRNIRIIANEDSAESGVVVNVEGNSFSFKLEAPCGGLGPCYEAWESQASSWNVYDGSNVSENNVYVHYVTTGNIYFYAEGAGGSFDPTRSELCGPMPTEQEILNSLEMCAYDTIGWTTIRDTLYIFATNSEAVNPGGVDPNLSSNSSSYGAIFKIEFNLETNASTSVEVVYSHDELNFSKYHQIEAIGRYETEHVQRLYWTDNFNTVRTINVKDPLLDSLIPSDLSINPSVTFTQPKVEEVISSGELPAGMYQYAYRLKNLSGAETRFSPFTGFLHIVAASEGNTSYWEYSEDPEAITEYTGTAVGTICSKSVKLKIDNIDTDYDTIEVAAIYKTTKEGVSSSYIFARQSVVSDTVSVTHSSNQTIVGLISLVEITSFNYNIKRAKSIATKDNRLFIGNVITPFENLKFNARAYRYKRDDDYDYVYAASASGTTTYSDDTFDPYGAYVEDEDLYAAEGFTYTLQENLDAINPYNTLRAVNKFGITYKFQSNGTTLGGEGLNVSYKFIKKSLSGDNYVGGTPASDPPFVDVSAESGSCTSGTDWLDYKNPMMVEGFRGYQRDEVYRYGIVLHDLQGNPGFVNWVGDIRFPRYKDFDNENGEDLLNFTLSQTRESTGTDEYNLTGSQSGATYYTNGNVGPWGDEGNNQGLSASGTCHGKNNKVDTHVMYALGIEFSVQIPSELRGEISGYSIVRVERKEIDKTVLGIGMGSWMYRFGDKSGEPDLGDSFQMAHNAYMATWVHNDGDVAATFEDGHGQLRHTTMNMDSPDFALTGKYPVAGECDWVEMIGSLSNGSSRNAWENDFLYHGEANGTDDDFYRKMYSHLVTSVDSVISGNEYIYMQGGTESSDADGAFFKPKLSRKLASGDSIAWGDNDEFLQGLNNIAVEVNGTTSQDTYSIGCDTLLLDFEGYTPSGDWQGTGWLSSTPIACPYWEYWTSPSSDGDNENNIYFNNNEEYNDNVTYFADSDPLDTSMSGAESDSDDRYNNPWGRSKVQVKPLMAWRRERPDQYGGNTYEARSRSIYMSTGAFVSVENAESEGGAAIPVDVWGGDTFVHFYDFQKMRRWRSGQSPDDGFTNNSSGPSKKHSFSFVIPVESTINIGLRTGYHFANKENFTGKQEDGFQLDEHNYDQVYSAEADLQEFYPTPYNYVKSEEFDSRVLYSQVKVNGDKVDSWRQYKINDYRDMDSGYGPINKIITHKDTIYYFQDRGVGMLSINPVATATTDQGDIVLGTGAVIQNNTYLGAGIGCKHKWSVLSANKGLYWLDILTNSVYKIGGEGAMELSRVKGMKSYFESFEGLKLSNPIEGDRPLMFSGVTAGYDAKNNEVLFSIINRDIDMNEPQGHGQGGYFITLAETMVYSETTGTFTSFYDFATPFLINTQDKLLSVHPTLPQNVFLHNSGDLGTWYGNVNDSVIRFIVNKNPTLTKTFDSLEWHMEGGSTWTSLICETDYQDGGVPNIVVDEDVFRRERTWRMPIPRSKELTRLRDKYLINTFIYNNDRRPKFRVHYIKTNFRVSKR